MWTTFTPFLSLSNLPDSLFLFCSSCLSFTNPQRIFPLLPQSTCQHQTLHRRGAERPWPVQPAVLSSQLCFQSERSLTPRGDFTQGWALSRCRRVSSHGQLCLASASLLWIFSLTEVGVRPWESLGFDTSARLINVCCRSKNWFGPCFKVV